jgi:hypothetical protein
MTPAMTTTTVQKSHLQTLVDFDEYTRLMEAALKAAIVSDEPGRLVRFFARYIAWNGYFGCSVASLAGKIGCARHLFTDPAEPFLPAADRNVLVASYIFDAARDEFDDHSTRARDPHRSLAQAFLKGIVQTTMPGADMATLNALAAEPAWLKALNQGVLRGYGGGQDDSLASIFHAMGYHLGSELLADREFTVIGATLREAGGGLAERLFHTEVDIGSTKHKALSWVGIHSGEGGAVEADHFEWATQGVNAAFDFIDPAQRAAMLAQVEQGFAAFAQDHRIFFDNVNIS